MTQQVINVGTNPNDGTGDTNRAGWQKANSNFTELYGDVSSINSTYGSASAFGLVKVNGTTITASNGVITAATYTLPTASNSVLGGVKVDGTTITISGGIISATAYSLPAATTSALGGVKIDGSTIVINSQVISVPTATSSTLGLVKPDGTTITNSTGAISVTYGTSANTACQGNDSRVTGALSSSTAASTYVPQTTTVAGHSLSGNVTIALTDTTQGKFALAVSSLQSR